MPDTSAILSLPYILPAQAQKHVTHNEALRQLDLAVQLCVSDRDLTAAPSSPVEGDRHIVAVGGTGDWAGQDLAIAQYSEAEGWLFTRPLPGWRAWVAGESALVVWDGSAWQAMTAEYDNLDGLGINTSSDATNRLAVSAPATLLSHEGAGHQLKINKAASGDTASLLYQSNWSGRAEMGLAGNEDFAIKTSADGSTWTTALSFEAASGLATGEAVQQSATDTSPGRLARADYAYGPGNLLGAVSESGGVPTGAVIDQGQNSHGQFVRFADGTLICTGEVSYSGVSCTSAFAGGYRSTSGSNVIYPAIFDVAPKLSVLSNDLGGTDALIAGVVASHRSYFSLRLFRVTSGTADFSGSYVAVGRWF